MTRTWRRVLAPFAVAAILTATAGCGSRTAIDETSGSPISTTTSVIGTGGVSAGTGGSGSTPTTGGSSSTSFAPPKTQWILFEITYRGDTSGNRYEGIFLTREGGLYSFDHYASRPRTDPIPIVQATASLDDLMLQYGDRATLVGQVDTVELFQEFETVHALRTTPMVQSRTDDSGEEVAAKAWEYDENTQLYSAIRLWSCGDFLIMTLSSNAVSLVDWLFDIGGSYLQLRCTTQMIPVAVTDCSLCSSSGASCIASNNGLKYCSTHYHCGNGCECQPVCAGGPAYCHDNGTDGLYCSEY